jgi:hypothetical protein
MKFPLSDLNFFQNNPNRRIALCYTKRRLHVSFVLEDFFVLFTKLPLRPVRMLEGQYKSVIKGLKRSIYGAAVVNSL